MRKTIFLFLSLLITVSSYTVTQAMDPEYFHVKGILTDTKQKRHQGLFDIRVSLWSSDDKTEEDTTANALWSETHAVKVNEQGKFEIKVGGKNPLPEPFDYDVFEYIQLEARLATGNKEYKHLDPRKDDDLIDRNAIMRYPYRPRRTSNTERQIQVQDNQYKFDENGELTMAIMPSDLKTTLTSLEARVTDLETKVQALEDKDKIYNSAAALAEIEEPSVGRLHYVVDEKNYKFYNGDSWKNIGGISEEKAVNRSSYHHNEIIKIHSRQEASPGIFYWDRTQKSYYVGMADGSLNPLFGESDLPGFIHDSWIDFRFANIDRMVIEKSRSVFLNQHNLLGLHMRSTQNNWSQSLALPEYSFDRETERTFEFVFHVGEMQKGRVMFGLADANIDVDRLDENSFHAFDVGLYMQEGGGSNKLYGKDQNNAPWFEIFEPQKEWKKNSFYKVVMRSEAENGLKNNWRIERVRDEDWTMVEEVLYEGESYNTATSETLKPLILLGGNKSGGDSNDYHLTGFRVY
jgi:hypothetical protein